MKKTIGILGGMGPEATSYFFELVIKNTKAAKDQAHIPIIIYNNPKVPPRTDAVLGKGPSPLPHLLEGVRVLKQAGADFVVMPCVTAHYYSPQIREAAEIPFLSLLEEALAYAKANFPGLKRAGLIASTGTVKSKLFEKTFASGGIEIIVPRPPNQAYVMEAIFGKKGVKAGFTEGRLKDLIRDVARHLIRRGSEALIAGCTEVPLVLKPGDIPIPLIEPMEIAAKACILRAGYKLK